MRHRRQTWHPPMWRLLALVMVVAFGGGLTGAVIGIVQQIG